MMVEISETWTIRVRCRVRCGWNVLIAGVCLTFSHLLLAHGSVVEDGDLCLIKIGFYQAHFTIYQPRSAGYEEYCEDLPDTGETVFVIDYLHDSMREVPVDFRIVHDRNGVGRFARYEDVLNLDLESDSVFYQSPLMQADAVFTVVHQFTESGAYIGVVTAEHPTEDTVYRAVFPFEVARFPWEYVVWLGVVTGLIAVLLWLRFVHFAAPVRLKPGMKHRSGLRSGLQKRLIALVFVGTLTAHPVSGQQAVTTISETGQLRVSYSSELTPIRINTMHSWRLHVEPVAGGAVENAQISVSGGMPDHDHGLPTIARVTDYLGKGDYLLEGMKFHMNGRWIVTVQIVQGQVVDAAVFELDL